MKKFVFAVISMCITVVMFTSVAFACNFNQKNSHEPHGKAYGWHHKSHNTVTDNNTDKSDLYVSIGDYYGECKVGQPYLVQQINTNIENYNYPNDIDYTVQYTVNGKKWINMPAENMTYGTMSNCIYWQIDHEVEGATDYRLSVTISGITGYADITVVHD